MYGRSGQNMYNRQNDDRAGLFGVPPRQVRPRERIGPRRITARYTLRSHLSAFRARSLPAPARELPCSPTLTRHRLRPLAPLCRVYMYA